MTALEAQWLATQLGIALPNPVRQKVAAFEQAVDKRGLSIGVDTSNGDWVVLDEAQNVLARAQ